MESKSGVSGGEPLLYRGKQGSTLGESLTVLKTLTFLKITI